MAKINNQVYMPVRNVSDYDLQDFINVCEHFKNSIFTYKFLGVESQAFRRKAVSHKCYYPKTIKTDKGIFNNPEYNSDIPELAIIRNPSGINPNIYITDVSVTDAFIRNMKSGIVNQSPEQIPHDAVAQMESYINGLLDTKLNAIADRFDNRLEMLFNAIGFSNIVSSPEFKAYLEFKEGTSKTFQEFCKFKIEGPKMLPSPNEALLTKKTRDEIALRMGYPSTEEWLQLIKKYDSYVQIAKMKNVAPSLVRKWASFHGIYSVFAENRK